MSQVIRAQYRAVIQKEAVPEKTEQAFVYWEEQLKKQCVEGGILNGTMCRYQDQLFLYLECIAADEQLADSRQQKAKIESFAQNILGDLRSVGGVVIRKRCSGGHNTQKLADSGCICIRSSGSMSRNPWRCGRGKQKRRMHGADELQFYIRRR